MDNHAKKVKKISMLSAKIDYDIHKKIREYCSENGIYIKKFIEIASIECINNNSAIPAATQKSGEHYAWRAGQWIENI